MIDNNMPKYKSRKVIKSRFKVQVPISNKGYLDFLNIISTRRYLEKLVIP